MEWADETNWVEAGPASRVLVEALVAEVGLSPVMAQIVARRTGSVAEAKGWLAPEALPLCDPLAFGGMRKAVVRIRRAITAGEAITVFGDYDTDGITATALLVQALKALGAVVKPFLPDRMTEGYGLTRAAVERCLAIHDPRPGLLITVDCGIANADEVAWLMEQGVEVVVTDHHTPPERLPPAVAVVNPRVSAPPGAEGLCGCAVAFTVVRALAALGEAIAPERFLDLVAVATIADVMDLRGENRALVARGLRTLGRGQGNAGVRALMDHRRILPETLTAEQIAFGLVPCINAAGRLDQVKVAYRLIGLACPEVAPALVAINESRKAIERQLFERILATLPEPFTGTALVCGGEDYHPGVMGIVAARLMERVGVPVAVVRRTPEGGGHGSMRACEGWHAVEALERVRDLLDHFGGHAAAAGFTLRPGCYEAFCERLPKAFQGARKAAVQLYEADLSEVPITLALCQELQRLEPVGQGNPKPRFCGTFTVVEARPIGADGSHLLLRVRQSTGGTFKAVWFGAGDRAQALPAGTMIRALFTLEIDRYRAPCPSIRIEAARKLIG